MFKSIKKGWDAYSNFLDKRRTRLGITVSMMLNFLILFAAIVTRDQTWWTSVAFAMVIMQYFYEKAEDNGYIPEK